MTYKELYESAIDRLEKSEITLGEFEKMIEPLNAEIATDSDTISRAKAIDVIEDYPHGDWNIETMSDMVNRVRQLPPAQPKRGKWEMGIDERFVKCSECGLMTTRNELRGLAVFGKNEPNFCPNCEAKMEVTT